MFVAGVEFGLGITCGFLIVFAAAIGLSALVEWFERGRLTVGEGHVKVARVSCH
jgi:hypothetical protein